jgi:hypothetical protein
MSNHYITAAYNYLKPHVIIIVAFVLYCYIWLPLLCIIFVNKMPFDPIIIGEFPLAPIIAMPFSIVLLLNAIFRGTHKLFYLILAIIIYLPILVISFNG